MNKNNPACYECKKDRIGIHTWKRNEDETATCLKCKLVLNKNDADDLFGKSK